MKPIVFASLEAKVSIVGAIGTTMIAWRSKSTMLPI